jgi:ribosomal protein S18 acetylase RimI-like enzyme
MIEYKIKKIKAHQLNRLSKILVQVYFNTLTNKELYYPHTIKNKNIYCLKDLKKFIKERNCEVYVAISKSKILGGVIYFSNLDNYELYSDSKIKKTSAIRYLAVDKKYSGNSIGKELLKVCINKTKKDKNKIMILHTLDIMVDAISLYEKLDFKRYKNVDFNIVKIDVKGYLKIIN